MRLLVQTPLSPRTLPTCAGREQLARSVGRGDLAMSERWYVLLATLAYTDRCRARQVRMGHSRHSRGYREW